MTENTIASAVRVFVRDDHGGLYAHSPQVPGLSIWGANQEEMQQRVKEGIRLLYKANYGIDVTVIDAADPVTMAPRTRELGVVNDYVLAAAA